jgi:hypothetical protein
MDLSRRAKLRLIVLMGDPPSLGLSRQTIQKWDDDEPESMTVWLNPRVADDPTWKAYGAMEAWKVNDDPGQLPLYQVRGLWIPFRGMKSHAGWISQSGCERCYLDLSSGPAIRSLKNVFPGLTLSVPLLIHQVYIRASHPNHVTWIHH